MPDETLCPKIKGYEAVNWNADGKITAWREVPQPCLREKCAMWVWGMVAKENRDNVWEQHCGLAEKP